MGIRTLHGPLARTHADSDPTAADPLPVPAHAAKASTARIPADPALAVRAAATRLRRWLVTRDLRRDLGRDRLADRLLAWRPDWRRRVEQARAYAALVLSALPRRRPVRIVTVFVAGPLPLPDRTDHGQGQGEGQDQAQGQGHGAGV